MIKTTIDLKEKANYIRKDVVETAIKNKAGHIASALSTVDILVSLYYRIMNIHGHSSPEWKNRDRFILSKAHGCYALYSILADIGVLPFEEWNNLGQGSSLRGAVEKNEEYCLEATGGSLGHGLPIAVGIAFGARLQNKKYRIYCIVGDGELQEGSMWEAIQFASKHKLSNLTMIVDNNGLQAMDFVENILADKDNANELKRKLSAFGFEVEICDGHNIDEIIPILENWKNNGSISKPQVLIANTTKGYGLKCMENIPKFHYRLPTEEELKMGNRYE